MLRLPYPPSTPTKTPPSLIKAEPAPDTVIVPVAPIPTPTSAKKPLVSRLPPVTVSVPALGPEPLIIVRPVKSAKDAPTKSAPNPAVPPLSRSNEPVAPEFPTRTAPVLVQLEPAPLTVKPPLEPVPTPMNVSKKLPAPFTS
jgi:hypothetical protein